MSAVNRTKLNLLTPNLEIGQKADPELRQQVFEEIYSELDKRPDTTEVLTKTNATAFAPTATTHPATKGYVDDSVASAVAGTIPDGTITPAKMSTSAKAASNITVFDADSHFAGTNVEAVLAELFQFANSGKTNIAAVVGSPATNGDTFSQLQMHIQTSKNTLATNLTNKGQSSTGAETLAGLVAKVANVNSGLKEVSGTATMDANYAVNVTGLALSSIKMIVMEKKDGASHYRKFWLNGGLDGAVDGLNTAQMNENGGSIAAGATGGLTVGANSFSGVFAYDSLANKVINYWVWGNP